MTLEFEFVLGNLLSSPSFCILLTCSFYME